MVKTKITCSDNFLSNGLTKSRTLQFCKISAPYVSESRIILTGFELQGDVARIKGVRKDKYFEISFAPDTQLININDQWKWYGNQKPK